MHMSIKSVGLVLVLIVQFLIPFTSQQNGLQKQIRIGALFEETPDPLEEIVFKHAVQRINTDRKILPNSNLNVRIEKVDVSNTIALGGKVCSLMRQGIAAIFGPANTEGATLTQSMCDAFDIPHVETSWNFQTKNKHKINLHPHPLALSLAYKHIVEEWQWENFVIIYDDNYGLLRLDELLKSKVPADRKVIIRRLDQNSTDYRPLLRGIMNEESFKHIVLDCSAPKAQTVLKQAQQVGMMYYSYSYLLTTLDLETMDIQDFRYGDINITAFRLVDPNRQEVKQVLEELNLMMSGPILQQHNDPTNPNESMNFSGQTALTTEVALMYDAVQLLGETLHVLDNIQKIDIRSINCERNDQWRFGSSIINYMHLAQFQGLTGTIKFDTEGYRSAIGLDVVQVTREGVRKIGYWTTNNQATFNWEKRLEPAKLEPESEDTPLHRRTIRVTTFLNAPFCMLKRSNAIREGNEQYEGFVPDLVERLRQQLKFKYIIHIVGDNNYGSYNGKTKTWNGMIGEILNGTADIAVADLAINKVRQGAVDFTMPFMNLGISILFTSPKAKPPGLFSFMSPFSFNVWVCMAIAVVGVPMVHFVIGRVSPVEWDNPYNCVQNPKVLHNQFTQQNSFWFTVGSIMQQGSDIAPKAISTRMLAGTWWFFTLIMVSSYTASLATFLIVQDLDESIKSLEDLAAQTKVKYGCVDGGSTAAFFKDSPMEDKRKIWDNMVKFQSTKKNNDEGIDAVKAANGEYAFFMESTLIEYNIERQCGLAQVGGLLDNKGYGIAIKKNSTYLQELSSAILHLQEKGVLSDLKRKWWKEERKETTCAVSNPSDNVEALRLVNLGGVFVVLVVGCIFATFTAFFELCMKTKTIPLDENETRWQVMMSDLRFALTCQGNVKPVKKKMITASVGEPVPLEMGSTGFLDLGITNSYGFPKISNPTSPELVEMSRESY